MWALSIFVAVIVLVILSLSGSRYLKRISRSIVSGILLSILLTLIDPTLPYVYGIAYLICLIIIWTPVRFWKRLLIAFPLVVALVLRISGSLCGSINEGNLWKLSDHKDNKSIYQTIIDNPEVNRIKESAAMDFQPYIPRLNSEKTLYPLYY